ncbi:hypothetical protein F2P81_007660 [Scophthalmus maximus]|uniref:Uncharacterized protein n=1 Tax=Scophthalmus maximus TaxID=52904 RepID=A0A6A4T2V1_SCOMX|nr:hypothetical protein F2P81_007660 [Scophthalmus maximus]
MTVKKKTVSHNSNISYKQYLNTIKLHTKNGTCLCTARCKCVLLLWKLKRRDNEGPETANLSFIVFRLSALSLTVSIYCTIMDIFPPDDTSIVLFLFHMAVTWTTKRASPVATSEGSEPSQNAIIATIIFNIVIVSNVNQSVMKHFPILKGLLRSSQHRGKRIDFQSASSQERRRGSSRAEHRYPAGVLAAARSVVNAAH